MIITFAGHSRMTITNELREQIKRIIKNNLKPEPVKFYCGGYGAFDFACAQIIKDLKQEYSNIESIFVTPYINDARLANIMSSELYDSSIYPDLEITPYRFAISKRNEFMIDKADLLICYVRRDFGGAYKTLLYAKRKHKQIINIAEST